MKNADTVKEAAGPVKGPNNVKEAAGPVKGANTVKEAADSVKGADTVKKDGPVNDPDKRNRFLTRLLYFVLLIASGVLVSFRGGPVPYLLFYFMLFVPVLALAYCIYVLNRFRIAQEVARTVVKAEEIPCKLKLANESLVPFTNITLHCYTEMITLTQKENMRSLSLLPHEKLSVDMKLSCPYRGTWPVGVKSVSVTDFLGLFMIQWPMKSQIRLTARPRILPLSLLADQLTKKDPKNELFSISRLRELPDFEVRDYQPGDPLKYIHWKNSARTGQLLVRKQLPEELSETTLLMDLSPVKGDLFTQLKIQDAVIETSLSFVHDYYLKRIPVRVVYAQGQTVKETVITAQTGFEDFYGLCTVLSFASGLSMEQLWTVCERRTPDALLITSRATAALRRCVLESRCNGNDTELIEAGDLIL